MNLALLKASGSLVLVPLSVDPALSYLRTRIEMWRRASLLAVFAATRVAAAVAAFVIVGLPPPGDVPGYYGQFAAAALNGHRDPNSPYNPGFDYIIAGLLAVFHSPLSFVFLMIAVEIAALGFVDAIVRAHDRRLASAIAARWLVCPISLFHVALGGHNDVFVLLTWAVVAWAVACNRRIAPGVWAAVGFACSKILAVFAFVPLAFGTAAQMRRSAVAFVAVTIAWIAACVVLQVPIDGVLREGQLVTAGNVWALPYILWQTGPRHAAAWQHGICAAALALTVWHATRDLSSPQWQRMLRACGTVGCVFLLLSPKSFAGYAVMFLPGLLFIVDALSDDGRRAWFAAVFMAVATFQPSVWFYFSEGTTLSDVAWGRPLMLATDLLLLAGYAMIARHGLAAVEASRIAGNRRQPSTAPAMIA